MVRGYEEGELADGEDIEAWAQSVKNEIVALKRIEKAKGKALTPSTKKALNRRISKLTKLRDQLGRAGLAVKRGAARAQEYRVKAYKEWVKLQGEVGEYSKQYPGTAGLLGLGETTIGLEAERRKKKKKKTVADIIWG